MRRPTATKPINIYQAGATEPPLYRWRGAAWPKSREFVCCRAGRDIFTEEVGQHQPRHEEEPR